MIFRLFSCAVGDGNTYMHVKAIAYDAVFN